MQSQPLQRQEQLLQCLHMLSTAENDQQRLVSLTILPRLLDPANALDMRAAVESIPWRFIARLVKTRSSEDTGRLLLCKIGTGVWSGFCDQGISTSVFLDVIPQAAQILCELDATIELKMLVMKSLLTLMASEPGLERMRDESVLAIILDTLEKQPEQVQELMLHLLETLYDHYGLSLDLGQFITKIALVTKENHSALRFKFMRLAVKLLCMDTIVHNFNLGRSSCCSKGSCAALSACLEGLGAKQADRRASRDCYCTMWCSVSMCGA